MIEGLNSWTITGVVKKYGVKGTKFPKLWILIEMQPIKIKNPAASIDRNNIFFELDIDANKATKKGMQADFLLQELASKECILIKDATVTNVKRSIKVPNTDPIQYETKEEPGVKTSINNIILSTNRFTPFNHALVSGQIVKHSGNRIIVEQTYRVPTKAGEKIQYKTRRIPLYIDTDLEISQVEGKMITCHASLAGTTPTNEMKTFGVTTSYIIHE